MTLPEFTENELEEISRVPADAYTHRQLTNLLKAASIPESGGSLKWERAKLALAEKQRSDKCGNNVAAFIQRVMDPVRFRNKQESYSKLRAELNFILAFKGFQVGEDGKFHTAPPARTLPEAERMAHELRSELRRRGVHADALASCRAELLNANSPNYFHAVLEATKSVAEKIRKRTQLTKDGAELVDHVFSLKRPLLAISPLQTESEKAEHAGFANIVRGIFGTFRNPAAHAPGTLWNVDKQDALDLLSLVSYLHRRLDQAVRTHNTP